MCCSFLVLFIFYDPATPDIYTLSLHDALPILLSLWRCFTGWPGLPFRLLLGLNLLWSNGRLCLALNLLLLPLLFALCLRSEEHTSELQSRRDLVCRLLLEKKKVKH